VDEGALFFSRATPVQNRHRGRLARLKPAIDSANKNAQ